MQTLARGYVHLTGRAGTGRRAELDLPPPVFHPRSGESGRPEKSLMRTKLLKAISAGSLQVWRSASVAIKRTNVARRARGPMRKAGLDQKHNICLADTRPERYKAEENTET